MSDLFLHNPMFWLGLGTAFGAGTASAFWFWWMYRAMRPHR